MGSQNKVDEPRVHRKHLNLREVQGYQESSVTTYPETRWNRESKMIVALAKLLFPPDFATSRSHGSVN